MREDMSLIERKLADFILDNTHLLRDYSSQQLADAIGVSQSSVVKFSQKLGYRGYPDLKYAVNEAVIEQQGAEQRKSSGSTPQHDFDPIFSLIREQQYDVLNAVASLNTPDVLTEVLKLLQHADVIQVAGVGKSAIAARDFVFRLNQVGKLTLFSEDPAAQIQYATTLAGNSLLLVFSDSGNNSDLVKVIKQAKRKKTKVISMTRYGNNPIAVLADINLYVIEGDQQIRTNSLLMQLAMQHLCHVLFYKLCDALQADPLLEESQQAHDILSSK
jgi:DNA-binding MurR/RpiR family transcriptional regulator